MTEIAAPKLHPVDNIFAVGYFSSSGTIASVIFFYNDIIILHEPKVDFTIFTFSIVNQIKREIFYPILNIL
jgi:hypothetical protein